MNEELIGIMNRKKCPVCRGKIKRDVHVPRFGAGNNVIIWTCVNEKCVKHGFWWHGSKKVKGDRDDITCLWKSNV